MPKTETSTPAAAAAAQITRASAHVLSVEAHTAPSPGGCRAGVALIGSPLVQFLSVGLFTSDLRLQSLLETALATGNRIDFEGRVRASESSTSFLPELPGLPSALASFAFGYDITRVTVHNQP